MKKKFAALLFMAHLTVTGTAFAQNPQEHSQTPHTMEPVVVTASRIEEKAKDVTAFITVIPQEEIKKNQYRDVGDILRNYGLQVDSYSSREALSQISIRGVRTSVMGSDLQGSILVLVDGRRLGTDNISMIPMVNIERIEILRGPASVQYGTSAIGGVVNVITRRGTEKLSASAEAGIGSWETYQGQGSIAWAKGPFDFSGGISYMTAGDYYYGGNHRYLNTGLDNKTGYNANIGLSFLEEHRIGITVLGMNADHMGRPNYYNDQTPKAYSDRSNYSGDLTYEGGYKDFGLSWKGRYFLGRNDYKTDDPLEPWGPELYKSYTNYQGSQGQLTFKKSLLTLTGGVDWLNYHTSIRGAYYPDPENSTYDNYGVFALAKLAFFDDSLIVSGGVRHDEYRLKIQGDTKNMDRATLAFGIAWHATKWLTLKGNYGEAYRIPEATQLLGFKGMFTYLPNPDLKPEKAKTYDVGFESEHKSLNFGLTYFQTEYKNKIVSRYVGWDSQYYNADGKMLLTGLEGKINYDIGEAFDWSFRLRPYVHFTQMLERKNHDSTSPLVGKKVPNVSDLDLAYGVNFKHPGIGFEADLRVTYFGHQYVQDYNFASPTNGQFVKVGGKTTADLFLSQTIFETEKDGKFSVNAAVRNIADVRYALIKDYPQPGRSFYLGLRYDY